MRDERGNLEAELLALFARELEGKAASDSREAIVEGRESGEVSVVRSPIALHPSSRLPDEQFNDLALRIFRHQYAGNPILRAFWSRRGATPERVGHWSEIPGVLTAAFKEAPLCTFPPDEAAAVFETSGTTGGGRPGRHYFRSLDLYEASLMPTFEAFVLPAKRPIRMLNLGPNAEARPHSSLGHMLSLVVRRWGAPGSRHFLTQSGSDLNGFRSALREAEAEQVPVCLLGTAFGFIHWLDTYPAQRFHLAPGSRLMDTGGTKGRSREMAAVELFAAYERAFGIPTDHTVNEYGMTELSSQYYDVALLTGSGLNHPRPKRGPAWLRSLAVDPESLRPLPEGEVGLLFHFDLANIDSVVAVQTDDLGRMTPEGLQLLGRATGAEARGCSLAAEELMRPGQL